MLILLKTRLTLVAVMPERIRTVGPLITDEIENAILIWVKRSHSSTKKKRYFQGRHGRIQGNIPVYLPSDAKFSGKVLEQVQDKLLHE